MIEFLSSNLFTDIVILLQIIVIKLLRYQIKQMEKDKRIDDVSRAC